MIVRKGRLVYIRENVWEVWWYDESDMRQRSIPLHYSSYTINLKEGKIKFQIIKEKEFNSTVLYAKLC